MMIPEYSPFTKLKLSSNESVIWYGYNPTFHRFFEYGIVITNLALYLYRPLWFLTSWKRIPILSIKYVEFLDAALHPKLKVHTSNRVITFRTPYDGYKDEMDIDRRKLFEAKTILVGLCGQSFQSKRNT